jgi:hypothetical protein
MVFWKFKDVWCAFWSKNTAEKQLGSKSLKSDKPLLWNIYDDKTKGEHLSTYRNFHHGFKYKFLLPLIWISRRILRKQIDKPICADKYNVNLFVFDRAFDKSIDEWIRVYLNFGKTLDNVLTDKEIKELGVV